MTEGLHPSSCSAPGTHQSVSNTLTSLGCTPRPCVTADPMLARIGLPEWCRGSGRGGVAGRDRTRKRRECWVGSTPKTDSFCCNRVSCAQVLGGNCILPNCTAGCQRFQVRCKRRSPEKDRLTPM